MSHSLIRQSNVVTSQYKVVPEFNVGSTVSVHYKIIEGSKERIQIFKGVVINKHERNSINATFTILKNSTAGVKVERTFPIHSPLIVKIEIHGEPVRARKATLNYLHKVKDPIKSLRTKPVKSKPITN